MFSNLPHLLFPHTGWLQSHWLMSTKEENGAVKVKGSGVKSENSKIILRARKTGWISEILKSYARCRGFPPHWLLALFFISINSRMLLYVAHTHRLTVDFMSACSIRDWETLWCQFGTNKIGLTRDSHLGSRYGANITLKHDYFFNLFNFTCNKKNFD